MAVCYIDNIENKHATLDLRIAHRRAPDAQEAEGRLVVIDELGRRVTDGPSGKLGDIITVPPGSELLCDNLGFPWGDHYHISATVESKKLARSVVNRFSVCTDAATSWDYVYHRVNGVLNQHVEAGTIGNVPGINHSHWTLSLEANGLVLLKCNRRDGLSHKDAVTLIVGLFAGGLGVVAGLGALAVGPFAIAGLVAGVVGAAVGAGGGTAMAIVAWASVGAVSGFIAAGLGVAAGLLTVVGGSLGVVTGVWSVAAPVAVATSEGSPGKVDAAANKQGSWQSIGGRSIWQIDLGQAHSLGALHFDTKKGDGPNDTRRDFKVLGSNRADRSDAVFLGGATDAPGPDHGLFSVEVLDPSPYRYISVVKDDTQPFIITQLRAFARPRDLAAGRPARASSEWSRDYVPGKANDGGSCATGGWSAAYGDMRSFWQVDLGQPYALSSVQLVTRQDLDQPETRRNFKILASNDPDMADSEVIAVQGAWARDNKDVFRAFVETRTAYRYIRVVKTVPEYFFIAKLCVYEAGAEAEVIRPRYGMSALYSPESYTSELFYARANRPLGKMVAGNADGTALTAAGNAEGAVSALYTPAHPGGGGPEVFLRGGDGYLHRLSRTSGGAWTDESFPLAGKVDGDVSALFARQRSHSEAFFRGEDGLVHYIHYDGGRWGIDEVPFRASGASRGAISGFFNEGRSHAEAFAVGGDGKLHYFWLHGNRWALHRFTDQGDVTGAISGLYSPALAQVEVFFRGEDGGLRHSYVVNGQWIHHKRTEVGKVDGDICAVYQPDRKHAEVFFRGADGFLHYCYFGNHRGHDGDTFRVAGAVNGAITALFNPVRSHTEVYFMGDDGLLHSFHVEHGAWQHRTYNPDPDLQNRVMREAEAARQAQEAEAARQAQAAEAARQEVLRQSQPTVTSLPDGSHPPPYEWLLTNANDGVSLVLQWGEYTYLAYEYYDNRESVYIVAYDGAGEARHTLEANGARDIDRITVEPDVMTVTFWGQGGRSIVVSWDALRPA